VAYATNEEPHEIFDDVSRRCEGEGEILQVFDAADVPG
jgi:hypothetical protein